MKSHLCFRVITYYNKILLKKNVILDKDKKDEFFNQKLIKI